MCTITNASLSKNLTIDMMHLYIFIYFICLLCDGILRGTQTKQAEKLNIKECFLGDELCSFIYGSTLWHLTFILANMLKHICSEM